MDFITGLPKSHGMSVILVVVDRFTKYAHFIALGHPLSALAELFMNTVVRLHGWPEEIIPDRDTIFLSTFWTGLMQSHGVKLLRSTAFHPQIDGQTKNLNKSLEAYLRCATRNMPKQWTNHLAMAELWYNTKFHIATQMTPFETLYGYVPTSPNLIDKGETLIEAIDYVGSSDLGIIKKGGLN